MNKSLGLYSLLLLATAVQAADYEVYYLGGQSNMDGYGFSEELPDGFDEPVDGVMIFHGSPAADNEKSGGGEWARLRPGHGIGFSASASGNRYSQRFGPELSLGRTLKALRPEAKIAIIKYSRDGTALEEGASGYGTWAPDYRHTNQYDHALHTIDAAMRVATKPT